MLKESLREIETQERETYFKYLRLITPEFAQQLGIPTEAPVFVSPVIDEERVCRECSQPYRPLIYQARAMVEAHHFHQGSGGIHYLKAPEDKFHEKLFDRSYLKSNVSGFPGWVAILEPYDPPQKERVLSVFNTFLARIFEEPVPPPLLRSSKVYVRRISAFCIHGEDCFHQQLTDGGVFSPNYTDKFLYPLCDWHAASDAEKAQKRFDFKIENGEIFFSLPSDPSSD